MRILKVFLILIGVIFCAQVVFSDELVTSEKAFFRMNKDLKRVGLGELKNLGVVGFESGNYRLDPDFRLGYGDTVTINLWGRLEATHKLSIDRDGNIILPMVGKIGVFDMTLDEARTAIKRELDKKYSNVEFDINLGDVRDIRVAVLGNIKNPGHYQLSPFCGIIEAVAKAGGPNDEGSLCDIRLMRDNKQADSFNMYDFLTKADESKNLKLKQGDVIYVSAIKNLIAIRSGVRYPGIYEVEDNTNVSKIFDMAGGLLPTKFKRKVIILRMNSKTQLTEIIKEIDFDATKGIEQKDDINLESEDMIIVTSALNYSPSPSDLFKFVRASGEINIPGDYLIKEKETLDSLLKRVGGIKSTGFGYGAIFTRNTVRQKQKAIIDDLTKAEERMILDEEANLAAAIMTQEERGMRQKAIEAKRKALNILAAQNIKGRIIVDLDAVVAGKADLTLEEGDSLYIPSVPDWVLVAGAVYDSKAIAYIEGKLYDYYLNAVGGPTKSADKNDIYIIKANGQVESKATGYGKVMQGDIIVVPENRDIYSNATVSKVIR